MSRLFHARILLLVSAIGMMVPLCLATSLTTSVTEDAKSTLPKGYVCYRATSPITIDGRITEDAWAAVPWTEPFEDIEGDKQPKPRYRTRVKMLWDDTALYIAAELEEPHVWATLTQHDSVIFQDNDFEVFLDPDGDSHLYAELEMNALNTTWDLLLTKPYKDGGKAINSWEIVGLKTAVHVDGTLNDPRDIDKGWTLEIKWPWPGLKELTSVAAPPHDGDQWRINFSRVEWDIEVVDDKYRKIARRAEHNWVWSPQGIVNMHRPETWGYVQFSTAKPGSVAFRPDPTGPARELLQRVYYAQHEYIKTHDGFARSLAELGLKVPSSVNLTEPRIETTSRGFEASLPVPAKAGAKARRLVITNDARVFVE